MSDLINVDLGDGRIFPMEKNLLEGPFITEWETDNERTVATVYRYRGKLVHESRHVTLKRGIGVEGVLGRIG